MLITEEYKKQCQLLHQTSPGWGDSAHKRNIDAVKDYCEELKTQDVLDYGCGKGGLATQLPFPIKEYDPAIPGKENGNIPADIVVCLDVLEHIEPECLKDVLADIWRCTKKLVTFSIAEGPARARLPDGRNAHLIQKDWEWWEPRLAVFFKVLGASEQQKKNDQGLIIKKEIHCLCRPKESKDVGLGINLGTSTQGMIHLDGAETQFTKDPNKIVNLLDYEMVEFGPYQPVAFFPENLEYSTKTITKWWKPEEGKEPTEERIAIIGYGPSLRDTWQFILQNNYKTIISTSGAYKFLLEKGIKPTHHVEIDWKPHKYKFTENAESGTKFLMSAVCNPRTIDNVKDLDSELIFIEHGDQIKYPEGAYVKQSGYDVGQHAVILAKDMGYRNIDLYGFDYCFDYNKHRHAGDHGGRIHHVFKGQVGEKIFLTSKTMFAALLVFDFWLKNNQDMHLQIFGDTLLINFLEGRHKMREKLNGNTN